jgi:hypothetical protein
MRLPGPRPPEAARTGAHSGATRGPSCAGRQRGTTRPSRSPSRPHGLPSPERRKCAANHHHRCARHTGLTGSSRFRMSTPWHASCPDHEPEASEPREFHRQEKKQRDLWGTNSGPMRWQCQRATLQSSASVVLIAVAFRERESLGEVGHLIAAIEVSWGSSQQECTHFALDRVAQSTYDASLVQHQKECRSHSGPVAECSQQRPPWGHVP